MNIWFVIWVFVATFILGTSVWSYSILLRQKRAWETFAKKCDVRFQSSAILKSPTLNGMFNGFEIEIFSDQPISGKFREGGARTIFQITLKTLLPTSGVIASKAFKNFIDGMSLTEKFVGEGNTALSPEVYNKVVSAELMTPYMTRERVAAFNALLNIKSSPAIFLFGDTETLLRIESADPFEDPARLEKFVTKVTDAAKIISV